MLAATKKLPTEAKKAVAAWSRGIKSDKDLAQELFPARTVEDFTPMERAAIALAAQGIAVDSIGTTLGLKPEQVNALLRENASVTLLCQIQEGLGLTIEDRLQKAAPIAVGRMTGLMFSGNEKTAADASKYILDQAIGKALQRSEILQKTYIEDERQIDEQLAASQRRLAELEKKEKLFELEILEAETSENEGGITSITGSSASGEEEVSETSESEESAEEG